MVRFISLSFSKLLHILLMLSSYASHLKRKGGGGACQGYSQGLTPMYAFQVPGTVCSKYLEGLTIWILPIGGAWIVPEFLPPSGALHSGICI